MKLEDSSIIVEKGQLTYLRNILSNLDEYRVTPKDIGEGWEKMKISSRLMYTDLLVKNVEAGRIVMFYKDGDNNTMIPFIPVYDKNKKVFKCLVNIKPFVSGKNFSTQAGESMSKYDIDEAKLHCLLLMATGAIIGRMTEGFANMSAVRDAILQYQCTLWLAVLNRVTSIADSTKNTTHFKYVLTKWILARMYEKKDESTLKGIANKVCGGIEDTDRAIKFDMDFSHEGLADLDLVKFLDVLGDEFPQLKGKIDLQFILRSAGMSLSTYNILSIESPVYVMACIMGYPDNYCIYPNKIYVNELLKDGKFAFNAIKNEVVRLSYATLSKGSASDMKLLSEED